MKSPDIIIYTDGSSRGNPGPGGWGAMVATHERVVELGGGDRHTTNNKMELMAAIESLDIVRSLGSAFTIEVRADSRYVVNGITKWVFGWQKNGWRTSTKEEVANRDLWERLAVVVVDVQMSGSTIIWNYIPGHSGIPGNERADEIATAYADSKKPNLFDGAREEYKVSLTDTTMHSSPQKKSSEGKERQKMKAYSYLSLVEGILMKHATWAECEKRVKGVARAKWKKSVSKEDEEVIAHAWKV